MGWFSALAAGLLAALISFGCSSRAIVAVKDAGRLDDPASALVAFSVAGNASFPIRQLDLLSAGSEQAATSAREVRVDPGREGSQLFLFAVPATDGRFGRVRFIQGADWWETEQPGPVFTARSGAVTYLGRIEVHSVQIGRYVDSGRAYPAGVKIRVLDASAEDLPRLAERFSVPPGVGVEPAVAGDWTATGFAALRYQPIPGRKSEENLFRELNDRSVQGPDVPAGRRGQR